jgi:hypothetical protein
VDNYNGTTVTATAGLVYLSELADQLGWLASAMNSSPSTGEAQILRSSTLEFNNVLALESSVSLSCEIRVRSWIERGSTKSEKRYGTCWRPLFRNPSLVQGFPIFARPDRCLGLEIALDTLVFILGTDQVVQLNQRILIKGFNFLAVALQENAGVVRWHLLHSRDSFQRIAYDDPQMEELYFNLPQGLTLKQLGTKRHIIGWCSEARDVCGRRFQPLFVAAPPLIQNLQDDPMRI